MSKTKPLTFYYKTVKTNDNYTLQEILKSLNALTVEQRLYPQGNKSYVLNHISEYEGMYYAEIICFERDKMQSIINTTAKDNNLNERNITTKDIIAVDESDDTPSEFIQSRIIFGLSNNNLAICLSKVRLQTFVDYINFLLNEYYWKDPTNAKAILILDAYTKDLKEKLKTTHVKEVRIGQGVTTEQNKNNRYDLKQKTLLNTLADMIKLPQGFKSALDDANLQTYLTINYNRTTSSEGQKILDEITTSLAMLDDNTFTIIFEDGSDLKDGVIRKKGKITQRHNTDQRNSFDRVQMQKDIHAFLSQSLE